MPAVVLPGPGEQHLPILVWGRSSPASALAQLKVLAAQPYVVEHLAAMPDLHVAKGVAVGTVFATDGTVVPAALGGDLGCGMSAVRFPTPAARLSHADLERLLATWGRLIPVGDATHRGPGHPLPDALLGAPLTTGALQHTRERVGPQQLGTLGGGNHFLELDRDGGGDLWLLVHSGSRGLGSAIAAHHTRAAEALGWGGIPGLRSGTDAAAACLADMEWSLSFARANREVLLRRAAEVVTELTGAAPDEASRVDVHHNFVRLEVHLGKSLLIHRKGAIAAPSGTRALIPGSMATASYVVVGLGEPRSFASASHGAGRVMTRREARDRISSDGFKRGMRKVVFDDRRLGSLIEEAKDAYRDIREVLEDEADLVRPVLRLEPLAVLKG